ncbi:hypothetical protein [Enterocloster clostridioformis]|nr:hypothetical protein [Enterocloster clostridioformis]
MELGKELREFCKDEQGVGVIELVLVLVGILTPYYGVGIRCIE